MTNTNRTFDWRSTLSCTWCILFLAFAMPGLRADDTWVYAVQISATVQVSPPQITLRWQPDGYGPYSYTVYRKAKDAISWGSPLATLSGSALSFTDTTVSVGTNYEYGIVKVVLNAGGYTGYGYIYTGI